MHHLRLQNTMLMKEEEGRIASPLTRIIGAHLAQNIVFLPSVAQVVFMQHVLSTVNINPCNIWQIQRLSLFDRPWVVSRKAKHVDRIGRRPSKYVDIILPIIGGTVVWVDVPMADVT